MQAYSPRTNNTYESWDDLVAAEANGYVVVVMIRSNTDVRIPRVVGPFTNKSNAVNGAARTRYHFKKHKEYGAIKDFSVHVEPVWTTL